MRASFAVFLLICSPSFAQEAITYAGNGKAGYQTEPAHRLQARIDQPFGLVVGPDEALYVCEVGAHVIRRIDPLTQQATVFAGTGQAGFSGNGELATKAQLNEPYEIRFDNDGHLFVVEMKNHIVRRIDARTGRISLIAGTGEPGFSGDGGQADEAQLSRPHSIALDGRGNLFICDIGNHRIRKVDLASGQISTFAGTGEKRRTPNDAPINGTPLNGPRALDIDADGNLILALREGNQIFRIDMTRKRLHHVAGTGRKGYSPSSPARQAQLSGPKGVAVAPNGDIYFADTESHTIRVVRTSGIVETVMGDGTKGDGPDGDAQNCRLDRPHGVFVASDGRLFVGDSNNHRVRVLQTKE